MSDILIKGMEMPKNCKECMFADFDDVDFDYVLYCTANEKYADLDMYDHPMGWNCPLIEIPTPHGNLKDESDIISLIEVMFCKDKDGMEHAIQCVKDASTVIEAEGSEE